MITNRISSLFLQKPHPNRWGFFMYIKVYMLFGCYLLFASASLMSTIRSAPVTNAVNRGYFIILFFKGSIRIYRGLIKCTFLCIYYNKVKLDNILLEGLRCLRREKSNFVPFVLETKKLTSTLQYTSEWESTNRQA